MIEEAKVAEKDQQAGVPRRQALCGIVAMGLIGPAALAACSSDAEPGKSPDAAAPSAPAAPSSDAGAAGGVATVSELASGGGKIVTGPDGKPVVLVKAADGTVTGFSAACTHKGVTVGPPAAGVIACPAHGSKFNIDGTVASGPATAPLAPAKVTVTGDNITLG